MAGPIRACHFLIVSFGFSDYNKNITFFNRESVCGTGMKF